MTNAYSPMQRRPGARGGRALARVALLSAAMLLTTACSGSPTAPSAPPAPTVDRTTTAAQLGVDSQSSHARRSGYMLSSGFTSQRGGGGDGGEHKY